MNFISKAARIKRIMPDLNVPYCIWLFNSAAYALWDAEEIHGIMSWGLECYILDTWLKREDWKRQKWQTDQEHEQIWGVGEKGWEGMRRASVPPSGKLTINEDLQQLGSVNSSKLSRDSEICEQRQQRSRVKESFKLMNKRWNMMELFRSRRL